MDEMGLYSKPTEGKNKRIVFAGCPAVKPVFSERGDLSHMALLGTRV
jgi:hypothetical protein